ncbi:MAG: histidine phosphatase family protein [Hyphomonadaceae bacterium]|nr:histidine phosphatase family protein [Hyphomonadaceae bacterium]
MARLYLIRHGEPASGWAQADPDPGLSALGRAQAAHAAGVLGRSGVCRALTSPLRRCRETAAAFEMEAGVVAAVEMAVREVPTPDHVTDRPAWLAEVMAGPWSAVPDLAPFRRAIIDCLLAQETDTAIFSHYVAINAAVSAAVGSGSVMVFKPAHASVTVIETTAGELRLIEKGAETPAVNAL